MMKGRDKEGCVLREFATGSIYARDARQMTSVGAREGTIAGSGQRDASSTSDASRCSEARCLALALGPFTV